MLTVGITCFVTEVSFSDHSEECYVLQRRYMSLYKDLPVRLVLLSPPENYKEIDFVVSHDLALIDALVISGGSDINKELYDGSHADSWSYLPRSINDLRDLFEIKLARGCFDLKLPVLGICRGHQVLNVALGGSLIQDIPTATGSTKHSPGRGKFGKIKVFPEKNSKIGKVIEAGQIVSCRHHQCVDKLGENLICSAYSQDGIIEAIESTDHPFFVGVQWHPEKDANNSLIAEMINHIIR